MRIAWSTARIVDQRDGVWALAAAVRADQSTGYRCRIRVRPMALDQPANWQRGDQAPAPDLHPPIGGVSEAAHRQMMVRERIENKGAWILSHEVCESPRKPLIDRASN